MGSPNSLRDAIKVFAAKFEQVKTRLGPQPFEWYPYNSFGYLAALETLLDGGRLDLLKSLAGDEPILDVGCGDGALAFFFESLGFEVDAVDNPPTNHNDMRGVRVMREALGSRVSLHEMDIDAGFHTPRQMYGLTLFLGILYHLKNPFQILEALAARSRYCLLSTRIAQKTPKGVRMESEALAYLVDDFELNQDPTNYWIFSEEGLKRVLKRSGWTVRAFTTTGAAKGSDPVHVGRDQRAHCLLESARIEPRYALTFVSGCYPAESEDHWFWTAPKFTVAAGIDPLKRPEFVELHFVLSEALCSAARTAGKRGVTVTASHVPSAEAVRVAADSAADAGQSRAGNLLGTQLFTNAGEHVFRAPVAHIPLPKDGNSPAAIAIEFAVEPALIPASVDTRRLGVQIVLGKARSFSPAVRFV